MSDVRKRPVERLEKYLTVLALIAAAVLAIAGVFWVRKPYMVSTISCNFFSIGFQAVGVFSVGFFSVGIFSLGVFSVGVFSVGLFSMGLLLGWRWCLLRSFSARHGIRIGIVLVTVIGICAGGAVYAISRTFLRDYFQYKIAHATFSPQYIADHRGKVIVEIPEVYELAHVIIAVSEHGKDSYQVHRQGDYYERAIEHFGPFRGHRVVQEQIFSRSLSRYYGFRSNSYCYAFEGDKIRPSRVHWNAYWPDAFRPRRRLLEDFASTSGFREFYRANLPYYQQLIDKYRREVPIEQMWQWLEERFPARYDCYRVVLSPLLGGTHNTHRFEGDDYREAVMFVSARSLVKGDIDDIDRAQEARTVFTEIDHNYVNPVTDLFAGRVKRVFADLDKWNEQNGYRSPYMTFNEYMTWAVFILYLSDTADSEELFQQVSGAVADQMINSRQFIRFRQFSDKLLELYKRRGQNETIIDLYPKILDWADTLRK
jgi:hypothetical protein